MNLPRYEDAKELGEKFGSDNRKVFRIINLPVTRFETDKSPLESGSPQSWMPKKSRITCR